MVATDGPCTRGSQRQYAPAFDYCAICFSYWLAIGNQRPATPWIHFPSRQLPPSPSPFPLPPPLPILDHQLTHKHTQTCTNPRYRRCVDLSLVFSPFFLFVVLLLLLYQLNSFDIGLPTPCRPAFLLSHLFFPLARHRPSFIGCRCVPLILQSNPTRPPSLLTPKINPSILRRQASVHRSISIHPSKRRLREK